LPMTLCLVAARLAARPHWTVSDLVDRLRDDSLRLDELSHDGVDVRSSISRTLRGLSPDAQRLFRLLAVPNTWHFPSWVGSPLLETNVVRAQELLEELAEAYLIDVEPDPVSGQARYQFHDIMWPLAREYLVAEESVRDRQKALERLLGALLYLAREAHQRVCGGDLLPSRSGASVWPLPEPLVDRLMKDPLVWYEVEHRTLVSTVMQAAATGLVEYSWDLALSAATLFKSHTHYDDWRRMHETALKAACQVGDRPGEAAMRYSLGSLYAFERLPDEASHQLSQALSLYRKLGDRRGAALALREIAYLNNAHGDRELAIASWEEALAALQTLDDSRMMAWATRGAISVAAKRKEQVGKK
jgi:tetratricopeptide (TPR) repeat protein